MKRTVWRLTKEDKKSASNGNSHQRWNSEGAPVLYAAQSQALAVLEMLAHLENPELTDNYALIGIELDDSCVEELDTGDLPRNWNANPPPPNVKSVGDEWLRQQRSAALRVPSALLPHEFNFLLNTNHPDFQSCTTHAPIPFRFDLRLMKENR